MTRRMRLNAALFIFLVFAVCLALLTNPAAEASYGFDPLSPPSATHWLGTDEMGHDLFKLLFTGFGITAGIAMAAALAAIAVGLFAGLLAAYHRGWVDKVIFEATGLFIIIPEIVLLTCVAAFAKPHIANTILAIAFFSWSKVARIIRAKALTVMAQEKIQYTLLLKGGLWDVLVKMRHDLYPIVAALLVLQCSRAAIYEATMAFLGIGDPMTHSLGRTIRAALDYHGIFNDGVYLWYLFPPVACLCLLVMALSALAFNSAKITSPEDSASDLEPD